MNACVMRAAVPLMPGLPATTYVLFLIIDPFFVLHASISTVIAEGFNFLP